LEAQKLQLAVVDPYAEVFCRAVGGEWADLLDGKAPGHPLKTEFGNYFVDFQAVRTRYFDTYFEAAAAVGVRQIVILAAGLGTRLAMRRPISACCAWLVWAWRSATPTHPSRPQPIGSRRMQPMPGWRRRCGGLCWKREYMATKDADERR
jgi:hypothetical protein